MTLPEVAWKNVTRSLRAYALYLVSVAGNVFVFYLFSAARHDPLVAAVVASKQSFTAGMTVASVVIALFAAVFLWYSASFFLRRRNREIGLYGLFGVGRLRISAMFFAENMLAGAVSLVLGLLLAVPFSKLFLMILLKILDLSVPVRLSVSLVAIRETLAVFAALLAVASLAAARRVYRFRLADTFRAEKAAERRPRRSRGLGLASLAVLAAGYAIAFATTPMTLLPFFFLVSAMTIVGTWAFARGGGDLVLSALRRSARFRASGARLIALGNLTFRIGSNARVFFAIAVVSTVSMVALGVGLNLRYWVGKEISDNNACTLSYLDDGTLPDAAAVLRENGARVTGRRETVALPAQRLGAEREDGFFVARKLQVLPASGYLSCLEGRDLAAARSVLDALPAGHAAVVKPNGNEAKRLLGLTFRVSLGEDRGERSFPATSRLTAPGVMLRDGTATLVLGDGDWRALSAAMPGAERRLVGLTLADEKDADAAVEALRKALGSGRDFFSRTSLRETARGFDLALFVGILMGFVFLVSSCSILHFKQLMDASADAPRYEVLFKIGLSDGDAKRIAFLQVFPMYGLPLGLACAHGVVALAVMGRVIGTDFTLPIAGVVVCYAAAFLAFGALTTRSCLRLMLRRA